MTDRAPEFQYLGAIIDEAGFGSEFLDEIITLAREGLESHVKTIRRACGGVLSSRGESSPDNAVDTTTPANGLGELVTATHRLTNVVIALRLETVARSINECEAHARKDDLTRFCETWSTLDDTVEKIYREVIAYSERRSGI